MIEIMYNPDLVGEVITNKKGRMIKTRKYHMTKEEMIRNRKKWEKIVANVDPRTRNKVNKLFFNPYRKGIYYCQIQALFLLGANEWHSLAQVVKKLESYMSTIPVAESTPLVSNAWDKFRGKAERSDALRCKDFIGRVQENFIFFQRLTKRHPYGYKLRQVGAAIDVKRVSKEGMPNGLFYYRLSTYKKLKDAWPQRDYTNFIFPKHERKYVSYKFIGRVVMKDHTIFQGVEV